MYRLSESNEDSRDTELMVCEVFHDVGVESENAEFVGTHNSREELHDEDFVLEGVAFVVSVEHVVEFFAERLGVVEELEGGEVDWYGCVFAFSFLQGECY